jgi:hypothetical protein
MIYDFFNHIFYKYPRKSHRFFEIIPPLTSVTLITMPFWGSFIFPVQLAYFILFFNVYWLYKSFNLLFCLYISSKKILAAEKMDWLEKADSVKDFEKVKHVVIIPNYIEPVEKLRQTLETITSQSFPLKRMFVFIAMEERDKGAKEKKQILETDFKDVFGGLYFTFHPDLPNEVKGKSSNEAYAGREAYRILIQEKKMDIDYLTVSSVDADSLFHKQYFSYLAYMFLTSKNRYLRFWQSANVNYNNFWKVPAFTRIISFFGSLWRTALLVQGLRLIPNSTYSLSFRLLKQIDFWDTDVIPEDYRIFFKAFFKTGGKVEVEPIYLKTSMDAPLSPTYLKSLMNKYNQERRWSWGISDDALYLKWYFTVKNVPFLKKTFIVGNVLLDHILWPVNWYIITISANVVAILNPVFTRTTLGYNLPRMSAFILTLCLVSLLLMVIIDFSLRTEGYEKVSRRRKLLFLPEFILMPVAGFFLSSFPALVSHIQLIFGKRLEYKVTEKV